MNWKKGMKWIVAVFAVLVLMSVFVGAVSAEEISTITLTGITAPVAGQSPVTSGISVSENNLTVGSCVWKTESDGSVGSSFDYGTVYKLLIQIGVKDSDNNTLSSSPTVTPNGASYTGGQVTITFPKTADITTISDVTITLTAPVTGVSKSDPQSSVHTTATVSWAPELTNGKFSGGENYTATVTVTADAGYVFSDSVSVKLNDETASPSLSGDKKSFTVTEIFPKTAAPQQETPTPEITSFTPNKTSGVAPLTVSFSFTANNAHSFELKSGSETLKSGTSSPLDYTFTTAGTYSVKLVAINGAETKESSSVTITVSSAQTLTTLSTVNLEIAAPVVGAKPATSVNGTGIRSKSVTWSPNDSSFIAGTYKATIKVENDTGYVFSSNPSVTINGKSVGFGLVSVSGNNLTVSNYPFTLSDVLISSVSLKVDAPSIGEIPYNSKVTAENSAKYNISSVTWYKTSVKSGNELSNTTAFASNTVYAVKIILTAKDGYRFDDNMKNKSVKVNSDTLLEDPSFPDGSGKLIMQYAFPMILEGAKPTISLSADPENPEIKSGLDSVTVKFTYKITGDYDAASINFGEGDSDVLITQSGGTIPYTYTSPGTYTVLMRAGNENGTVEKKISVPVTKEKFKASFSATVLSGEAPLSVIFTDTSTGTSGKVIQRSWEFGDGKTESSLTSVPHTFEKEGTYYVKLFISDGTNQDTATKTITVTKKGETAAPAADVEYEPLIILGDVGIPSPLDLIAEFIRLFQEMLNFDNYTFFSGEEE